MGRFNDLTGKVFGRLTVLYKDYYNDKHHATYWRCKCQCGNEVTINGNSLTRGLTKSCGCIHKEVMSKVHKTHGGSQERLYGIWLHMKNRCYLKSDEYYNHYGGRGISVCEEWKDDYLKFREWSYSNGYDENAKKYDCTLDRIDVNGNYEPNNCRWVNQIIQSNNRRNNHKITINEETHTIAEWTRIKGFKKDLIYNRLNRGWSEYDAVMTKE